MPELLKLPSLYYYSLQATFDLIVHVRIDPLAGPSKEMPFDTFPSHIVTDLMEMASIRKNEYDEQNKKILFTPTVTKVIINWCVGDLEVMAARCRKVNEIIVVLKYHVCDVGRMIKLVSRSSPVNRIIFTYLPMVVDKTLIKHSVLGQHPTIYSEVYYDDIDQFLLTTALTPGVGQMTEFYLQSTAADAGDIETILKCCPSVRVLRHSSLVKALYGLHQFEKNKPRYKLKNLDMHIRSSRFVIIPASVKLCVQMCPEATVVDFSVFRTILLQEIFLQVIEAALISLSRLEVLRFGGLNKSLASSNFLHRVIDKHGIHLRYLGIEVPEGLDVMRILRVCPNLRSLHLIDQWSSTLPVPDISQEDHPEILDLEIQSKATTHLSPLGNLLLSRSIVKLELAHIAIDENVLDRTVQSGYWPNLSVFKADCCMNLKRRHVISLLESENNLTKVSVSKGAGISSDDLRAFQKCIDDLKLNVSLDI